MSRRGGWRARGGQEQAAAAIDAVLDERPQRGEEILTVADAQIEDSPYQARATVDATELAELAEGMRTSGFQGVLLVRAHPQREGHYQLVYGHRRRLAWRQVCAERGIRCELPVLVRSFTDQQLLTIGAQENLQRADLTPLEEAQVVVWHQQLYFELSLREIGALLGKSESWAKKRSQVAQLPAPFKEVLQQYPTVMSQVLEVARLWDRDPQQAIALVNRVGAESLSLVDVRTLVQDMLTPQYREKRRNQSVDELIVTDRTIGETAAPVADRLAHTPSPDLRSLGRLRAAAAPVTPDQALIMGIRDQTVAIRRVLQEWATVAQYSPALRQELLSRGTEIVGDLEQLMQHLAPDEDTVS